MAFSYKPLWHKLLEAGMSKTEFREAVGIGTAQLANMGKGKYISMESLDKICAYFDCQPNEIIEYIRDNEET